MKQVEALAMLPRISHLLQRSPSWLFRVRPRGRKRVIADEIAAARVPGRLRQLRPALWRNRFHQKPRHAGLIGSSLAGFLSLPRINK